MRKVCWEKMNRSEKIVEVVSIRPNLEGDCSVYEEDLCIWAVLSFENLRVWGKKTLTLNPGVVFLVIHM